MSLKNFVEEHNSDKVEPTEKGAHAFDFDEVARALGESVEETPETSQDQTIGLLSSVSRLVIKQFCKWLIKDAPANHRKNTETIDADAVRKALAKQFVGQVNGSYATLDTESLIEFIVSQKLKSRQRGRIDAANAQAQEAAVGRKAILTVWLRDPAAFTDDSGKGVSLHQIAESMAMTAANLSPQVQEISQELGITNEYQEHDWKNS